MTQFSKSNSLILISSHISPSFKKMTRSSNWDIYLRTIEIVVPFYTFTRGDDFFKVRSVKTDLLNPPNERQRRRSTFISKLRGEERAESRDRAGQKQGVLPPHWWEVVSFMLKQHILRGSAASKIGERCRRIS